MEIPWGSVTKRYGKSRVWVKKRMEIIGIRGGSVELTSSIGGGGGGQIKNANSQLDNISPSCLWADSHWGTAESTIVCRRQGQVVLLF